MILVSSSSCLTLAVPMREVFCWDTHLVHGIPVPLHEASYISDELALMAGSIAVDRPFEPITKILILIILQGKR